MNYGAFICFLALLPRSLVLVRCLREANVAVFFAEGLVGVDKHLFQRLPLNYIFVLLLANIDVILEQKQLSAVFTKENLIHVTHGKTKRQQIVFHN